jgi:hypothetical protein
MAFTSQQIRDYLIGNPGMTDAQIVAAMETFQISPAQMASAVGLDEGAVAARVGATVAPGMSVTLGDTVVTPQYQYIQSGEDNQVGALETVFTSKTTGDPNYKAPVGTPIQIYSATGDFINTVKTKKDLSFFGGIVDALKDPYVQAAILGATAGASGLFSGAGTAATVGTTGLTAAEIASLTAGDLAIGGGAFAVPTAVGATAAGLTAAEIAALTAQDLAIGGGALAGTTPLTAAQIAALTAQDLAIGGGPLAGTPPTTIPGLLSPPVVTVAPTGVPPTGVPPTGVPPIGVPPTGVPPTGVPPTGVPPTGVPPIGVPPIGVPPIGVPTIPDITKLVQSGLTAAQIAALFQSTAQTGAGLLQQQTSREAAQKAQQMIDAETAAAKQSAAFRPIGMTTRFGTSQFQVDPVTGQLTSAGYTLSPEAKNAQDRFLTLAGAGLTQAEQAQQQFAPLQTGAQRLFGLGNQYLAQNPQEVAQNYLNQQMALLQPGRETELANLQNRLQQQGRGGLSVAQGGTLGATTPELQALYNARATQEAQLAAQAQQAGQQQVAFGAGLLGTGAQTMGQYYGGQQAAYTPYTTALGQVQGLEQMAQQPFGMSTALAQQASQAGANVGRLGLSGAEFSTRLATSPAATTNPYSTVLGGVGASNQFGQFVGGLFGGVPATTAMSAPATTFGTGNYYGSQDLGLYL